MEEDLFIEGHQDGVFDADEFDIVLHALKLQELVEKRCETKDIVTNVLKNMIKESQK